MWDEKNYENMKESDDLGVWRGILFGLGMGTVMWAGILWLAWVLLF